MRTLLIWIAALTTIVLLAWNAERVALWLAWTSAAYSLNHQVFHISGVVVDQDKQPLSDVQLHIREGPGVGPDGKARSDDRGYTIAVSDRFDLCTRPCATAEATFEKLGYFPERIITTSFASDGRTRPPGAYQGLIIRMVPATQPTILVEFVVIYDSRKASDNAGTRESAAPRQSQRNRRDWEHWFAANLHISVTNQNGVRAASRPATEPFAMAWTLEPQLKVSLGIGKPALATFRPYGPIAPSRLMQSAPESGYEQAISLDRQEIESHAPMLSYAYFHLDDTYGRIAIKNASVDSHNQRIVATVLVQLQPDGSRNLCWPAGPFGEFDGNARNDGGGGE